MKKYLSPSLQPYARPPVIGAAFAVVLVLSSILLASHSFFAFFSLEGLMIVVGGVIAVAFMSFDSEDVHKALRAIRNMLDKPPMTQENLRSDMTTLVYCARLVKEKGMRDLESAISSSGLKDSFVKYGLNMVVSQYEPNDVRAMMETAADAAYERDSVPADVLQAMASHAPAFGMVGTLVGMVAMLCSLNGDMSNIGPSLAVSFLSTLYGVISARMVYIPAASKVRQEAGNRRFRNQLITEGMVMLVANKAPMHIQDRLNSFLKPEIYNYYNVIKVNPTMSPHRAPAAA